MELFEEDYYLVEKPKEANINMSDLFVTYLPLVKANALALYGVLWAESKNTSELKHSRLCKLVGIDIDDIEIARCQLEKYGLLRTYYNESSSSYLYRLVMPLYGAKFFDHYVYGLKYKNILGLNDYEISRSSIVSLNNSTSGYKEITTKLDKESILSISESVAKEFVDSRLDNIKEDDSFGFSSLFDYQSFMRGLTPLTFPKEVRTNDNIRFIGRLSTMANISMQRLRELACQCINIKTNTLNKDRLLKKVLEDTDVNLSENVGYDINPLQFLQSKQNGVAVSTASTNVLEYLVNDTNFTTDIVNIIVEFVLDTSDNKLPKTYTQQVAETFARSGVKTQKDALELVKKLKKENKIETVRYQNITKVKPNKNTSEEQVDPKELEALQKELLEMFKK